MSVSNGRQKYERKAPTMAASWNAAKARAQQNWANGMTSKAGVTPGPARQAAYAAGMNAATFSLPPDAGARWEANYRAKMSE